MKRKYYILGTLALLCLLGTGYYAWTLYDAYRKQVAEWNEGAKAAFEEALWMEVNKRAAEPMYSYSSGEDGMTTLKERIPDSVFVTSVFGRRGYRIERFRYENSLIKETLGRGDLGTLLEISPLSVDSLSIQWNSLLLMKQLPLQGYIRYVNTDLNMNNDTIFSEIGEHYLKFDSLTVKYMGFRCEHELVAYVSNSNWTTSLDSYDLCILSSLWLLLLLIAIYYSRLEALVKHKLTHEKIVEKEVIIEKGIHVVDVQIDKANVFKLPDGTLFDSFEKVLSKGEIRHNIQPQSVALLKLFLSKSDYRVTATEISLELWKNEREKEKLYSAIRRLRNDLKAVNSELIITCTNGEYELKSPISSKNSD